MSDQLLGILIPAIATIAVALIAAIAGAGKGRDTAVLLALAERDAEIRRLEAEIRDMEEPHDEPNHPRHPRRHG